VLLFSLFGVCNTIHHAYTPEVAAFNLNCIVYPQGLYSQDLQIVYHIVIYAVDQHLFYLFRYPLYVLLTTDAGQ
jgi:hypothetical protein